MIHTIGKNTHNTTNQHTHCAQVIYFGLFSTFRDGQALVHFIAVLVAFFQVCACFCACFLAMVNVDVDGVTGGKESS